MVRGDGETNFDRHQLLLVDRKYVEVTGVTQIASFDRNSFVLMTIAGNLVIRGEDLSIKALSLENGFVSIEGSIQSSNYSLTEAKETTTSRHVLRKLFR